jgi:hypothetical protein
MICFGCSCGSTKTKARPLDSSKQERKVEDRAQKIKNVTVQIIRLDQPQAINPQGSSLRSQDSVTLGGRKYRVARQSFEQSPKHARQLFVRESSPN